MPGIHKKEHLPQERVSSSKKLQKHYVTGRRWQRERRKEVLWLA